MENGKWKMKNEKTKGVSFSFKESTNEYFNITPVYQFFLKTCLIPFRAMLT